MKSESKKRGPVKHYQQWQRDQFRLDSAVRKYYGAQKRILETTSLKDLIK